MLGSTVVKHRH